MVIRWIYKNKYIEERVRVIIHRLQISLSVLGIFFYGSEVIAMKIVEKTRPGFCFERSDGVKRYVESSGIYFTPAIATHYKQGITKLYGNARFYFWKAQNSKQQGSLSMKEQTEVIKTAAALKYKWMMGIACNLYAQTISCKSTLQSLLDNGSIARATLELPKSVDICVVKNLYEKFNPQVTALTCRSTDAMMRLLTFSLQQEERQDSFLLIPGYNPDDIVLIKRDFDDAVDSEVAGCVFPWIIQQPGKESLQVLDQKFIAGEVAKVQGRAKSSKLPQDFNARAFKISRDGSLLLGFCDNQLGDIDTLVCFDRNVVKNFEFKKVMKLTPGILTKCHKVAVQQCSIKHKIESVCGSAYGALFDIQTSFVLHPYERFAAYIGTDHAIHFINLSTKKIDKLQHSDGACAVAWHPQGDSIAWVTASGKLCIHYFSNTARDTSWSFGHVWHSLQWNFDGSKVLLMANEAIYIVDTVTGEFVRPFTGEEQIAQAVLSDDSTKLCIVTAHGEMSLWDVEKQACLAMIPLGSVIKVMHIILSPDAKYVCMCGEENGVIKVYRWNVGSSLLDVYHTINKSDLLGLSSSMESGVPLLEKISLPQMLLFVAIATAEYGKKIDISKNSFLVSQFQQFDPFLKKYLKNRIIV
jgi:WD40 repeat protein